MQETLSAEELLPSGAAAAAQQFRCGPCAVSFATLDELKAHYRSDLHKSNREQSNRGGAPAPAAAGEQERAQGQMEERLERLDSKMAELLAAQSPT